MQYQTLQGLFRLSYNNRAFPQVKGLCLQALETFEKEFKRERTPFAKQVMRELYQFRNNPDHFETVSTPRIPDGSPLEVFNVVWVGKNLCLI